MESRIAELAALCRSHRIDILYSFGSRSFEVERFVRAEGPRLDAGGSDCDIGAHLDARGPIIVSGKVAIAQTLEDLLGVERVDLVLLQEADPFLACNVIRGERLYCLDTRQADEYELYVLRRAGDLAPLERARQALLMESS